MTKIAETSPKKSKSEALKTKALKKDLEPQSIYFRSMEDLTIHGGITTDGSLVIVPILPALGVSMKSLSEYSRQAADILDQGVITELISACSPYAKCLVNLEYPALTSSIPLPGPRAIDHIIETGPKNIDEIYQRNPESPIWFDPEIAQKQLHLAMNNPRWRPHRLPGYKLEHTPLLESTIETLLSLENTKPGILTANFWKTLIQLQGFFQAMKTAAQDNQLVPLSLSEVRATLETLRYFRTHNEPRTKGRNNWRNWFELSRIRAYVFRSQVADATLHNSKFKTSHARAVEADCKQWILVPDVGFDRFYETQTKIRMYQRGIFEDQYEKGLNQSKADSIKVFLWKLLTTHSEANNYFQNKCQDITHRSQFLDRRTKPGSATYFITSQTSVRGLGKPATIVIKTEKKPKEIHTETSENQPWLSINPMVAKPDFVAAKTTQVNKKFPTLSSRYQSLAEIETEGTNQKMDLHYYDSSLQWTWPYGRLWQMVDLLKTLLGFPEHFLNPDFLANNSVTYPPSFLEGPMALDPGSVDSIPRLYSWRETLKWFEPIVEFKELPSNLCHDELESPDGSHPLEQIVIEVLDGGMNKPEIGLGVRFETDDSRLGNINLDSLLDLLKRTLEAQNGTIEEAQQIYEKMAEIRFTPRAFFEIDGLQVEPEVWFAAKKSGNGYFKLPGLDILIAETDYLDKSKHFELRQKVYAIYQRTDLTSLWKIQMEVLKKSPAMSLEEYLKHLTLKIAPVFQKIDAISLGELASKLAKTHLSDLVPTLRPYQLHGIAWCFARMSLGFGICLADEMGLGKTIQAIALMRVLKSQNFGKSKPGQTTGPVLVVIPKSLKLNWLRELRQFGQGLNVKECTEDAASLATLDDSCHVVLTTYPRLRIDCDQFSDVAWSMVVLDEAHAIKNTGTQTADVVHGLKSRLRLALTGTPVENRAEELWSLMNWLNPGYLGDQASFCHYTSVARSSAQKRSLMAPLRVCLDPLILRRLKKDPEVALGLPDKVFADLTFELSAEQVQLYQSILEICVTEGTEALSQFQRKAIYLRAILHLKQICIHPDLFFESAKMRELQDIPEFQAGKPKKWAQKIQNLQRKYETTRSGAGSLFAHWTKRSGKLQGFSDLITDQKLQSRGILIFTQYLGAAEMLQRVLSQDYEKPVPPLIYGGLTPAKRQDLVDEFNAYCYGKAEDNEAPILILSLKAGGTGLNLTGADCVIHFDRWWNPAVEDQATDRAHRIGQTNQVLVQTLTSLGTIEESITDKFESKRKLSADLLGAVTESDFGDQMKDDATFLQLVDPKGMFRKTLQIFS